MIVLEIQNQVPLLTNRDSTAPSKKGGGQINISSKDGRNLELVDAAAAASAADPNGEAAKD